MEHRRLMVQLSSMLDTGKNRFTLSSKSGRRCRLVVLAWKRAAVASRSERHSFSRVRQTFSRAFVLAGKRSQFLDGKSLLAAGVHTTTRGRKQTHLRVPFDSKYPKDTRRTPERKKERKLGRKKRHFWAPMFGPHLSTLFLVGSTPLRSPPPPRPRNPSPLPPRPHGSPPFHVEN